MGDGKSITQHIIPTVNLLFSVSSRIAEHADVFVQPAVITVVRPAVDLIEVFGLRRDNSVRVQQGYDSGPQAELERITAEQERLRAAVQRLEEQLQKNLDHHTITSTEKLHQLAKDVVPRQLFGYHIGLLGNTATGKSSMVNTLMGSIVTSGSTTQVQVRERGNYHVYDFPGQNDDFSYFSKDCISLMKGLTRRLVLVTATVKEMKRLVNLFEAIDLHYDFVVNKLDLVDLGERPAFVEKIRGEINEAGWKNVDHIWFVSAEHLNQFPEWLQMVSHLAS